MGLTRGGAGRGAIGGALAVVVLASCGPSGGTSTTGATMPATTTYTASPLEPYVPLYTFSADEQRAISAEADELIAACMKDQGFDYDEPYEPDEPVLPSLDGLTAVQWAELYGYGVSTLAETASDQADAAVVERGAAEQQAYDAALYGTGSTDAVAYDWQQEGCMGAAYHEASGGADELMRDARFAELFAAIDLAREQAATSEQTTALDAEWSACLAEAGHPGIATPADAVARVRAGWLDAGGAVADDEVRADLRAEEIAVASADAACQDELDYPARADQIVWAAEADLVAERQDELTALVAATG
ncbi:MAG TPA: hypothetical protein VGC37_10495 [Friedmanniella sp.]